MKPSEQIRALQEHLDKLLPREWMWVAGDLQEIGVQSTHLEAENAELKRKNEAFKDLDFVLAKAYDLLEKASGKKDEFGAGGGKPTKHESWIPQPHYSRLIEWGALDFVEQNLNGVEDGTGWVDVVNGIVYYDMGEEEWFTAALIHEASHVQQFKDGLQYYGSHAEAMADAVARSYWDGWPQRLPWEIPDNGPVGTNPEVTR